MLSFLDIFLSFNQFQYEEMSPRWRPDMMSIMNISFVKNCNFPTIKVGSGALPGLIVENNLKGCSFLFLTPAVGSNPEGSYLNPFPKPTGKANLYLT